MQGQGNCAWSLADGRAASDERRESWKFLLSAVVGAMSEQGAAGGRDEAAGTEAGAASERSSALSQPICSGSYSGVGMFLVSNFSVL